MVVPPFQVRVATWGLEARPAGDPLEQVRDVGVVKRLGFAVAPDEGDGSGGQGQAALGAEAPGLTVVSCERYAALDGDGDCCCLSVIDQAGEFDEEGNFVGCEVDDLERASLDVIGEVDGSNPALAIGRVPEMAGLVRRLSSDQASEADAASDLMDRAGCHEVDRDACVEE